MNRLQKVLNTVVWVVIVILGIYILGYGMKGQSFAKAAYACGKILTNAEGELQKTAAKTLYPGLAYTAGEQKLSSSFEEFLIRRAAGIFPLYTFMDRQKVYQTEIESTATYDILVEGGAHDENEIDERTGEGFDLAEKVEEENLQAAREQEEEQAQAQAVVDSQSGEVLGVEYLPEELADFHFVRDNFYVVETNTDISSDLLDANKFLNFFFVLFPFFVF